MKQVTTTESRLTQFKEIFNLDVLKPRTKITFTTLNNITFYGKVLECDQDVLTIKIRGRKPYTFSTDDVGTYKIELYEEDGN